MNYPKNEKTTVNSKTNIIPQKALCIEPITAGKEYLIQHKAADWILEEFDWLMRNSEYAKQPEQYQNILKFFVNISSIKRANWLQVQFRWIIKNTITFDPEKDFQTVFIEELLKINSVMHVPMCIKKINSTEESKAHGIIIAVAIAQLGRKKQADSSISKLTHNFFNTKRIIETPLQAGDLYLLLSQYRDALNNSTVEKIMHSDVLNNLGLLNESIPNSQSISYFSLSDTKLFNSLMDEVITIIKLFNNMQTILRDQDSYLLVLPDRLLLKIISLVASLRTGANSLKNGYSELLCIKPSSHIYFPLTDNMISIMKDEDLNDLKVTLTSLYTDALIVTDNCKIFNDLSSKALQLLLNRLGQDFTKIISQSSNSLFYTLASLTTDSKKVFYQWIGPKILLEHCAAPKNLSRHLSKLTDHEFSFLLLEFLTPADFISALMSNASSHGHTVELAKDIDKLLIRINTINSQLLDQILNTLVNRGPVSTKESRFFLTLLSNTTTITLPFKKICYVCLGTKELLTLYSEPAHLHLLSYCSDDEFSFLLTYLGSTHFIHHFITQMVNGLLFKKHQIMVTNILNRVDNINNQLLVKNVIPMIKEKMDFKNKTHLQIQSNMDFIKQFGITFPKFHKIFEKISDNELREIFFNFSSLKYYSQIQPSIEQFKIVLDKLGADHLKCIIPEYLTNDEVAKQFPIPYGPLLLTELEEPSEDCRCNIL